MGQVIPFRRPNAAQENPVMVPIAQYFIGMAIVGLIAISFIDAFAGKRR